MLSVAVLGLVLAQSCFEVETTTRIEPDGSGRFALDMSVNTALLEMAREGGDVELGFTQDDVREMRTVADTLPGIRFDTAYSFRDGDRTRIAVRFAFDSVAALQRVLERQASGQLTVPIIRQTGRTVRLSYRPQLPEAETGPDNPFGQMGRELALQMIEMRFRYLFPRGTSVDTARPAVRRTDSTAVYAWDLRDMMEASESEDSLFVTAQLPPAGPGPGLWILLGAAVLLAGGVVLLLVRRTR